MNAHPFSIVHNNFEYLNKGLYKAAISPPIGSCIWKKTRASFSLVDSGLKWTVGNGKCVNLWHDRWLLNTPLASVFPHMDMGNEAMVDSLIAKKIGSSPTTSRGMSVSC